MTHNPDLDIHEPVLPYEQDGPLDLNAEPLDAAAAADLGVAPTPIEIAPRRRLHVVPRTIAGRLVAGVTVLMVLIVVVVSIATYQLLRPFLINRLDQQITATGVENANFLGRCLRQATVTGQSQCFSNGPPPSQREWVTILFIDGRPPEMVTGTNVARLDLTPAQQASLIANQRVIHKLRADGQDLRAVGVSPSNSPYVIVTALSKSDVSRTLSRLLLLELGIGACAVALAFAATAYGVRLSLGPLRRVTTMAREVTAELSPDGAGLDRRVAITLAEAETEAGQLAESVNTLLGSVEAQFAARVESEERMRQFMADASHELRTPLTSIRGYAELARMRRASGGDGDDADTLNRIESEGTRMSRLVDDLLLLARSDQGAQPQHDLVDVAILIDDAVQGARASFPQRQIDIDVPAPVAVVGDHDQLLRVLRNLVTNAAVHTRADGPIRVSGYAEAGEVVLRVDDSGPGLPPEEAAHVFERFWRADKARTRARGGTGLGMAIVASIVEAHGGTVRFDSTVETGSSVTVRLPTPA